jgi:transposase
MEIVQPDSLVQAVDAAVSEIEDEALTPNGADSPSVAFQPRLMTGLLTYCYARQIYSSSQIVFLLRRDRLFRLMCDDILPDAEWISRFRRDNRRAILQCLVVVLLFQAKQKVVAGLVTHVNNVKIAAEAKRRIIMSAFTDSMELDECGFGAEA